MYVMGEYAIIGQDSLLRLDRFGGSKKNGEDVANLHGVRFVYCSELNDGHLDVSKLKMLTNLRLRARVLYQNSFEFDNTTKVWVDCNTKPRVNAQDHGTWRRIKTIPFNVQIPPNIKDEHFLDKLKAEGSGVLNYMLRGLRAWIANGRKLVVPASVTAATNDYRVDSDVFEQFHQDCIMVTEGTRLRKGAAYQAFLKWMEENGVKYGMAARDFHKRMEQKYGEPPSYREGRCYRGIELAEHAQPLPDSWQ